MDRAWQETPNALDWARRTIEDADLPKEELQAKRTGPRFYLNPWDDVDTRRCPDCSARTRKREQNLALMVEPKWLIVSKLPGRYCEACGLLTVQEWDTERAVAEALRESAPQDAHKPFVVVGTISDELMRDRDEGPLDPQWALTHVEGFRELFEPEEEDWGFADTAADESQDLLGPVILLPPGRP